jgi:hypothetical protein
VSETALKAAVALRRLMGGEEVLGLEDAEQLEPVMEVEVESVAGG